MADEKEVIIRVSADTGDAQKGTADLKKKLSDINDTPIDKPFKTFKAEIREAVNDAKKMEDQFGRNSKQFTEAAKRVAELKDRFGEFGQSINSFNPDNKLQALVTVARGATGAIQGVSGAMAFLGVESGKASETLAKLQGLMALSGALNSIDDLKNGFQNFKLIAVDTFKTLKASIGSTGIGLLVIAIGFMVEKLIEMSNAADNTNVKMQALKDTSAELAKAAASAAEKVAEVKTAFDLAREGVVSKKEALKKYNDTLGDTFGKTNDLNKAEKLLADNAELYIKITGLKAQANALFAKSGDEAAKAIVADTEDQTGFFDKASASVKTYFNIGGGISDLMEAQQKGVAEAVKKAKSNAKSYQEAGEDLLKEIATLSKGSPVKTNILDNKEEKKDKGKGEDLQEKLKKEREELLRHQKEVQDIIDKAHQEAEKASVDARQKELLEVDNNARELKKKVQENADAEKIILDAELKRKAISRTEYDKQIEAIHQQALDAGIAIETEKGNQEYAINKKYYDESVKAAEEAEAKKAEAKLKVQEQQTNEFLTNLKTQQDNDKISLDAKKAAIDAEREYVLNTTQYTADEKARILQALAEAEKTIDDKKLAAKKAAVDLETGLLDAASDLVGKNTVVGKGLAIASTTIGTYEAAQGAYKSQIKLATPDAPIRATAAAAIAVLQGLAKVKAIASVKIPTKNGGSSSGGASSIAPSVSAPQINSTLLSADAAAIKDVRVVNQQDQVIKTYISQNDLQANQDKQAFLNRLGTI